MWGAPRIRSGGKEGKCFKIWLRRSENLKQSLLLLLIRNILHWANPCNKCLFFKMFAKSQQPSTSLHHTSQHLENGYLSHLLTIPASNKVGKKRFPLIMTMMSLTTMSMGSIDSSLKPALTGSAGCGGNSTMIWGYLVQFWLLAFLRTVCWFDLFWDFKLFSENKFSVLVLLACHTFHLLPAIVPGNGHFFAIWTSFTSQNVVKTCLVLECTPSPHAKPPPPRPESCPRQAAQRRQGSRSPQVWDFPPWRQKRWWIT